ncbi:MAG: outer membrane protein assembly factor BamA, partial [Elusimicrobia bacterium]|nr:outer membrane protein assembly factor BamA [Elusimicrobiota bacterium]
MRAKLKAKEMAPYPPEDKALDLATLLASGDFISVKFNEVDLSPSAFRLDIELIEGTPAAPAPAPEPAELTDLSTTTVHLATATPTQIPRPKWTPRPTPKVIPPGQEGLPQPPWVIGDLAVQGNHHVKYNVIRGQVKARKGDLYDRADLDHDIQTLLGLGSFDRVAADIAPLHQPVAAHLAEASGSTTTVRITFVVEEKPVIKKIRFSGNKKLSKGRLTDDMTLKEKDPLDRVKLRTDEDKMLEAYHKKGFLHAAVDSTVAIDTAARTAEVTFVVDEGPKSVIAAVELEGVKAFKPKKVLKKMTNRRKKVFQEKELASDLKKIEEFYKNNGYLDFSILRSSVAYNEDKTKITISLAVDEGRQYRFGATSFTGYSIYAATDLVKALDYRKGKIFSQEKFDATIRNIQELYAERGRLRARVTPDRGFNDATGLMDVNFDVIEGSIVFVEHIVVVGKQATKSHVIRREIVQKVGQPFSASKIRKSQEKIMNLGFMEDIQLDITSPVDPDKVDLTFEVVEGKPGMLTMGAGFSSLDGLIGTLSLQHMNLLGRAQRASVQWQFGSRVQDYSLSWTTPWTGGKPTSLGVDLFNTRRLRPFESSSAGYVDRRLGGSLRVGPRFQEDKYQLFLNYTFQRIGVSNVEPQFANRLAESTSIHSSIGVEFAVDTRDSMWDPTRGSRNSIGVTLAGGPILNGNISFVSPTITNSKHFHLFSVGDYPYVLTLANRGGYVSQFGETKEVPVFNRFFLGGQDTLRGYAPSGEVGRPDGGKVYDVANVEFGFPLARERKKTIVKFVTFFDAGTTWDNIRSMHLRVGSGERDIKTDVGFGIRFVTPAFPIRLDW